MRYALLALILLFGFSTDAMAGSRNFYKITTPQNAPVVVNNSTSNGTCIAPCSGVINTSTINGGTGTGLTVSGTPAQKVINKGTITGTTGVAITGTSSSVFVNSGVIRGTNVGVSQLP